MIGWVKSLFTRRNRTDASRFDAREREIEEYAAAAGLYGGPTGQQILFEAGQRERGEIEPEHGEPAVHYANAKAGFDDSTADLEALMASDGPALAAVEAERAWERALTADALSRRLCSGVNAARWVSVAIVRLTVRQARIAVTHLIRLARRRRMRTWKRRADVAETIVGRRLSRLTGCYDRVYAMARAVSENPDVD